MSERERLTHKERIKKIDLKRIQALEKLANKIGIVVGSLILLISLVVTLLRGT